MVQLLAQSGPGNWWQNPALIKGLFWAALIGVSVLGTIIKKANEAKQKRNADLARRRREDDALRTGRPVVDNSDTGEFPTIRETTPAGAPSQAARQSNAEDARKKLQELAERRRRELAEMMRRAQQGQAGAPASASRPSAPAMGAPPSAPLPRPQQPAARPIRTQPIQTPQAKARPIQTQTIQTQAAQRRGAGQDVDARRRREADANRQASIGAQARQDATEAEEARREAIGLAARRTAESKTESAYAIPAERAVGAGATGMNVGAALAKVGAGGKGASAAEWRKAIVLSELLHRPVGMREDGESVI
jgi:hypothetical protein